MTEVAVRLHHSKDLQYPIPVKASHRLPMLIVAKRVWLLHFDQEAVQCYANGH